ncbi:MAG: DUF3307 domain-containing protein [Bacteroidales bacterium]|nr:DUF3307 domain-containing protein [Bacteroidales bacterium]
MVKLLTLQILAHIISDFYLQTGKSCQNKAQRGFQSPHLYVHVAITFICSWILSLLYPYTFDFWWASMVIAVLHGVIDGLKSRFQKVPWVFFIDQVLHLTVICAVVAWFSSTMNYKIPFLNDSVVTPLDMIPTSTLLWITAFAFCLRPANLFIGEILNNAQIKCPKDQEPESEQPLQEGMEAGSPETTSELPNAGHLIGNVERVLTLIFMMFGHFEAIGFLLAAKSLLRFKDSATNKSEYVLVGTLLSFGLAIIAGAIVLSLLNRV